MKVEKIVIVDCGDRQRRAGGSTWTEPHHEYVLKLGSREVLVTAAELLSNKKFQWAMMGMFPELPNLPPSEELNGLLAAAVRIPRCEVPVTALRLLR